MPNAMQEHLMTTLPLLMTLIAAPAQIDASAADSKARWWFAIGPSFALHSSIGIGGLADDGYAYGDAVTTPILSGATLSAAYQLTEDWALTARLAGYANGGNASWGDGDSASDSVSEAYSALARLGIWYRAARIGPFTFALAAALGGNFASMWSRTESDEGSWRSRHESWSFAVDAGAGVDWQLNDLVALRAAADILELAYTDSMSRYRPEPDADAISSAGSAWRAAVTFNPRLLLVVSL